MAYLLVMIVLIIGACYLMQDKLHINKEDVDVMFFGILGFGALECLAKLIVGLFAGATGAALIAYLIGLALNGGIAYYFYRKSGL